MTKLNDEVTGARVLALTLPLYIVSLFMVMYNFSIKNVATVLLVTCLIQIFLIIYVMKTYDFQKKKYLWIGIIGCIISILLCLWLIARGGIL